MQINKTCGNNPQKGMLKMKDKVSKIKTNCSKKMVAPKTVLSWYDTEDLVTGYCLVSCNRNHRNNYRKLAEFYADMHAMHSISACIGALDNATRNAKGFLLS